jgi:hypothetical protein
MKGKKSYLKIFSLKDKHKKVNKVFFNYKIYKSRAKVNQ